MKKMMYTLASLAVLAGATPAIAQEAATAASSGGSVNWVALTAGLSMALASAVCGYAQSKAVVASVEGMARNPGAIAGIRLALIIGLAFIESIALYTLVVIFLKVQ